MNPKHQLTSDNNYKPSDRASRAVSAATGQTHKPVVTDGPTPTAGSDTLPKGDGKSDNPRQSVGGPVPSQNAQSGSDKLDASKSVNDRKA